MKISTVFWGILILLILGSTSFKPTSQNLTSKNLSPSASVKQVTTNQNKITSDFVSLPVTPEEKIQPAPRIQTKYIPYEGNGGGPTLCNDGLTSRSSGRGTCSGHGGIAK